MNVVWQRIDLWLRLAIPSALAVLMALLSSIAWPIPYLGSVMPPLAFIALYYWSAHRPDLFPIAVAFAVGLLNDLINDLPLGISALLFTITRQIILQHQRFFAGHSFLTLWFGFILVAVIIMLAQWLLVDLIRLQIVPFLPILTQTLLIIMLFPLPCWLFIRLQRTALSNG